MKTEYTFADFKVVPEDRIYGHEMSLSEFLEACDTGLFTDYDGNGELGFRRADGALVVLEGSRFSPSERHQIPADGDFTVIWYNN